MNWYVNMFFLPLVDRNVILLYLIHYTYRSWSVFIKKLYEKIIFCPLRKRCYFLHFYFLNMIKSSKEKKKEVNNCNEIKQQVSQKILYLNYLLPSTIFICLGMTMVGFLAAGKKIYSIY